MPGIRGRRAAATTSTGPLVTNSGRKLHHGFFPEGRPPPVPPGFSLCFKNLRKFPGTAGEKAGIMGKARRQEEIAMTQSASGGARFGSRIRRPPPVSGWKTGGPAQAEFQPLPPAPDFNRSGAPPSGGQGRTGAAHEPGGPPRRRPTCPSGLPRSCWRSIPTRGPAPRWSRSTAWWSTTWAIRAPLPNKNRSYFAGPGSDGRDLRQQPFPHRPGG